MERGVSFCGHVANIPGVRYTIPGTRYHIIRSYSACETNRYSIGMYYECEYIHVQTVSYCSIVVLRPDLTLVIGGSPRR